VITVADRALSINAIAIPIVNGHLDYNNIFDEFGGFRDIQYRVLRTTKEANFIADPLRILRVFRFQSRFGFDIENLTWQYAVKNKHLLKTVAKERIKKEFNGILMGEYAHMALRNILNTGVLEELFEECQKIQHHVLLLFFMISESLLCLIGKREIIILDMS
jgi:tRNA nucleotidyltransferase/poly(A) polymerase